MFILADFRFQKQVQCTIVLRNAYFKRYSAHQSCHNLRPKETFLIAPPRSNFGKRSYSFGKIRIIIYKYYYYFNNVMIMTNKNKIKTHSRKDILIVNLSIKDASINRCQIKMICPNDISKLILCAWQRRKYTLFAK